MKTPLRWIAAGSLCVLAACQKVRHTDAGPEEGPEIVTTAPVSPTTSAASDSATMPQPNHLAPEGIFYLARPTSVETSDGIIGFRPGMRLVKQADGTYVGNGHKLRLQPNQVTNDLRVAERVVAAEQATHAALRQLHHQNAAAEVKARQPAVDSSSSTASESPRVSSTRSSSIPSSSLGRGASLESGSGLESGGRVGSGSFGNTGDTRRWHRKLNGAMVYE